MLQDEKEKNAWINNLFCSRSFKHLKEFLSIEMRYNDNLQTRFTDYFSKDSDAPVRDYKSDINLLYKKASGRYNMIEYGNEIDLMDSTIWPEPKRKRKTIQKLPEFTRNYLKPFQTTWIWWMIQTDTMETVL